MEETVSYVQHVVVDLFYIAPYVINNTDSH